MRSLTAGHVKAGWDALRVAKLRSFWTMLGVIIGVASVISIVAIGEGVRQQIGGQLHHLGKDVISVRPAQVAANGNGSSNPGLLSGFAVNGTLTSKDVTTVSRTKGVNESAPMSLVGGSVKADNGAYNQGFVVATTGDLSDMLGLSAAYGSFLTSEDVGANNAVLGSHAAQKMFNEDVPLGQTFTFHGQDFIVRGILNDTATTLFSQQVDVNNAIFIPYDVGQQLTNNSAVTYQILAKAGNPKDASAVSKNIQQALDKSHGGQSNLSVTQGSASVTANDYILELLTRMIAGVAAISLLVGGVGIMNVMLVSVAERVHEIGIRKAVGATDSQILNQFLAEATLLSLVGGILGIILAVLIDVGLRAATVLQPVITWQIVVVAIVVSLLVGIIFGTAPALKAARKDPIDALRSE